MRKKILAVVAAAAMTLAACATGGGYGGGYGGGPGGTQLSQCMRNALIGAGVGAVLGGVTAPEGNRTENAALGAAIGGLGAYGVCRWLNQSNQSSAVENSYYTALNTNQPVNRTLTGPGGQPTQLSVSQPRQASGYPANCRTINAQVSDASGVQQLPQETFCQDANGGWVPTA